MRPSGPVSRLATPLATAVLVVVVTVVTVAVLVSLGAGPRRVESRPVTLAALGCGAPGQVLDLSGWKLTLPTGSGGSPTEVNQLDGFGGSPWFRTTPGCDGVMFRAPVDGATTKGSSYPRSELREMGPGNTPAAWSADSGSHWLSVVEAFTALPQGKPELVGAQIHDDHDDIAVFRLEGSDLWVTNGDNPHYKLVTDAYQLGTAFEAGFLVTDGMVGAYYNGQLVAVIAKSFSNAYFKVGAYTQANCAHASPCDADNYGETVVYALTAGHGTIPRA